MIYEAKTKRRIKRKESQLPKILRLVEVGQECKDVISQLSSVRSRVNRTISIIVSRILINCKKRNAGTESLVNTQNP